MNHYIEIVEFETEAVIERKGPYSERQANRIDDGMNINLNHDKYFTRIVEEQADRLESED